MKYKNNKCLPASFYSFSLNLSKSWTTTPATSKKAWFLMSQFWYSSHEWSLRFGVNFILIINHGLTHKQTIYRKRKYDSRNVLTLSTLYCFCNWWLLTDDWSASCEIPHYNNDSFACRQYASARRMAVVPNHTRWPYALHVEILMLLAYKYQWSALIIRHMWNGT